MADKDYGLTTEVEVSEKREGPEKPDANAPANVFERYINFAAIVNFGFTMQAGWEAVGVLLSMAFLNGGPASLVWGTVLVGFGSASVAMSLGEMASMDPAVGAQYRWSARFAKKNPEFWGLMQGWITVFAWITNLGASLVILANITSALITFHYPSFEGQSWHITLLMWAFIVAAVLCNLFLRRILNAFEVIGGICHVVFYIAAIIVLTTLGKRSSPEFVFKNIINNVSGWSNPGVAWNLGLLTVVLPLSSFDGVLHMIDETKQPRKRVPYSMIMASAMNSIMLFGYLMALLFCIGDFDEVSAAQLPILEIYYRTTGSKAAATVLVLMHTLIITISLFNLFASVSRLTWAFARDNGLPFAPFFTSVHPTLQVPLPALALVSGCCAILALINIGSEVAFAALISLPTVALNISYFIPIYLLVLRKLSNQHPVYGPFRLGKWGLPVNLVALVFTFYCLIWTPFPPMYPVTAANMNYAGPITVALVLIALMDWFTTGKKRFQVPTGQYQIEMQEDEAIEDRSSD